MIKNVIQNPTIKNTKLIKLLSLFNKGDFKKLGLFVRSPYYNRLKNVVKLYDALKKYYPKFENKNLIRKGLYNEIFPGTKYDDIKIRTLQSYLFGLAEKYIAVNQYEKNKLNTRLDITAQLRKKGEVYFMNKNAELLRSQLDKIEVKDADYYHSLYRVTFEENYVANQFSNKRDMQKEADSLTIYYLIMILRTYGTAFNRGSSLNIDIDTNITETIENLAQTKPYNEIPVVAVSFALYMIARYMDENYFFSFLEHIQKHPDTMNKDELYDAYYFLVNFCVLKIQKGDKKFVKIKLELYKNILKYKLWEGEGYLSYVIFNNAISSAIENTEYSFAEKVIKEYRLFLEPSMKNDMVELSHAKLKYAIGSYDKALEHLSKIKSNDDIFYKFAIKDLYIKIYYEMGHWESIFSLIDSYKHFLHTNKLITDDVKKRYGLFLGMFNELVKIKIDPTTESIKEMRENILTSEGFVNKDWLAEKLLGIKAP
jgi:hypothetical protein